VLAGLRGAGRMTGSSDKVALKKPIVASREPVPDTGLCEEQPATSEPPETTTTSAIRLPTSFQPQRENRARRSVSPAGRRHEAAASALCTLRVRPNERSGRRLDDIVDEAGETMASRAVEMLRRARGGGEEAQDGVTGPVAAGDVVGRRNFAVAPPATDPFRDVGSVLPMVTVGAAVSGGGPRYTPGGVREDVDAAATVARPSEEREDVASSPAVAVAVPSASTSAERLSGPRVTMPPVGDGKVSAATHGGALGRNTPIRPGYHRTENTTPNQMYYDHRRTRPNRRHAAPPMTAGEYAEYARAERGGFFDAYRYNSLMLFRSGDNEDEKIVLTETGQRVMAAQEAWKRRWAHWAGRSDKEWYAVGLCDSFFVRCEQERNYQRRLSHLIEFLRLFPRKLPNVDLVMLSWPFDGWYSVSEEQVDARSGGTKPSRVWWLSEVEFEERMRRPKRGRGPNRVKVAGYAIGWEQVDNFAIPVGERNKGYFTLPVASQDENEIGQIVPVPTAPVYAYATGLMMHDASLSMSLFMVAASERIVLSLMAFLAAAKYGGHHPRDGDPRINCPYGARSALEKGHTAAGVIVPVGKSLLRWWSDRTIVYLCRDTDFEAECALRAVDAARWTDWSFCNMPEESTFLRYDWRSGYVYPLWEEVVTRDEAGGKKVIKYPAVPHRWLPGAGEGLWTTSAYHQRILAASEPIADGSSEGFCCFPEPNRRVPNSVNQSKYCRRADVPAYGVFGPLPANEGYPYGSGCGLAVTSSQPPFGYNQPHMPTEGGSAMDVNNIFSVGRPGPTEAPGVPGWVDGDGGEVRGQDNWSAAVADVRARDEGDRVGDVTHVGQRDARSAPASPALGVNLRPVTDAGRTPSEAPDIVDVDAYAVASVLSNEGSRAGRRSREEFEAGRVADESSKRLRENDDTIIRRFADEQAKRADAVQNEYNELYKKNARLEMELSAVKEKLVAVERDFAAAKAAAVARESELKKLQAECERRERLADRFRRAGLAAHRQYRNEVLAAQSRMADNLEIFGQSKDESAE